MPTKGKCWSCGEIKLLFGTLLKKNSESGMYFAMCCGECKRFFEAKAKEGDDGKDILR